MLAHRRQHESRVVRSTDWAMAVGYPRASVAAGGSRAAARREAICNTMLHLLQERFLLLQQLSYLPKRLRFFGGARH
jgi:hypothetical protein